MNAHEMLTKAAAHMEARAQTYDKPSGERSMGRCVAAFNEITGHNLSPAEGWLLMMILKAVRLTQRATYHSDSAEDMVAYAALVGEAKSEEHLDQAVR